MAISPMPTFWYGSTRGTDLFNKQKNWQWGFCMWKNIFFKIKKAIGKKYILCRKYIAVDMNSFNFWCTNLVKKSKHSSKTTNQRCYHRHEKGIWTYPKHEDVYIIIYIYSVYVYIYLHTYIIYSFLRWPCFGRICFWVSKSQKKSDLGWPYWKPCWISWTIELVKALTYHADCWKEDIRCHEITVDAWNYVSIIYIYHLPWLIIGIHEIM